MRFPARGYNRNSAILSSICSFWRRPRATTSPRENARLKAGATTLRGRSVRYRLVGFYFAVAHMDDAVGALGDVVFVGDHDDGISVAMQPREQGHDFIAG